MIVHENNVTVDTDGCPPVPCCYCRRCMSGCAWDAHERDLRLASIERERKIEINND